MDFRAYIKIKGKIGEAVSIYSCRSRFVCACVGRVSLLVNDWIFAKKNNAFVRRIKQKKSRPDGRRVLF